MYQLLEPYMEQAISNAKKLANINKGKKASQSTARNRSISPNRKAASVSEII